MGGKDYWALPSKIQYLLGPRGPGGYCFWGPVDHNIQGPCGPLGNRGLVLYRAPWAQVTLGVSIRAWGPLLYWSPGAIRPHRGPYLPKKLGFKTHLFEKVRGYPYF